MKTQQFKSVNLREIVTRSLNGLPINVHAHTLFDCDDCDIDDSRDIIDEYSDELETVQLLRDIRVKKQLEYEQSKEQKGGTDNEPQTQKEPSNEP